jgi:hypothetical protein
MINTAIAKAYARRICRGEIVLEEVKLKVPADMFAEIEYQLEQMK